MDAEAVKFSLDRHRDDEGLEPAQRARPVTAVEVVDPLTVRLRLKAPFSPLVATLADRAGMPVSPDAGEEARRQVRDRAGLRRALGVRRARRPGPHRARASPPTTSTRARRKFDRLDLPDHPRRQRAARQPALGRHRLHAPGRARPTRASLKKEGKFERVERDGLGYSGITINLRNKTRQAPEPARRSRHAAGERPARARGASICRIDREALNQVAWDGQYTPGCTPIPPDQPLLRQEPQVPGARRGQGEEAPGRRRASPAATASS